MKKKFQITNYEPNKELALQPKVSSNTLTYFVMAIVTFLTICFTVVFTTFLPAILFATTAGVISFGLKDQFAELITFTPNQLIIDYKIGFITWKSRYDKVMELDWFVNVNEQPVKVKIGYKDKIILRFSLENLQVLPTLTQNVSELMTMEVDMNETVGKWENLRFRSPNQLPNHTQFHYLTVQQDTLKLKVLMFGIRRFEVDLQRKKLKYSKWLTTKTVDLANIKAIHYYFGKTSLSDSNESNWAYIDKKTNEPIAFFKYRQNSGEEYDEPHYTDLNFKIDNRNLARLLQNLPVFANIDIKEQKF